MKLTLAVIAVGLFVLWKRGFFSGGKSDLSESTMRRIRAAEGRESFARDMDDDRVVPAPPSVSDGPPTRALSKVGIR